MAFKLVNNFQKKLLFSLSPVFRRMQELFLDRSISNKQPSVIIRDVHDRIKRNHTPELVKSLQPQNIQSFGQIKEKVVREERHYTMLAGEIYNNTIQVMTKPEEKKVYKLRSIEPKKWETMSNEVNLLKKKALDMVIDNDDILQPKNLDKLGRSIYQNTDMGLKKKIIYPERLLSGDVGKVVWNCSNPDRKEFSTFASARPNVLNRSSIFNNLSLLWLKNFSHVRDNRKGIDYKCPRDCGQIIKEKQKKLLEEWNKQNRDDHVRVDNIKNELLREYLIKKAEKRRRASEEEDEIKITKDGSIKIKRSKSPKVNKDIKDLIDMWNNKVVEGPMRIDNMLYEVVFKKNYHKGKSTHGKKKDDAKKDKK